ncbi:hypothetical protein ACGGAQ_32445 [Micromonospora sp. NPDC047557]
MATLPLRHTSPTWAPELAATLVIVVVAVDLTRRAVTAATRGGR